MKNTIKVGIAVIVGIVLILSGAYYFYQGEKVEIYEIKDKGELKEIVRDTGIVSSQEVITISPAFEGKINFILKQGERVEKGDLVATLDVSDLGLAIDQLEFQINALEAQSRNTGITNPRYQEIHSQEVQIQVAKRDLEKATTDYEKSLVLYEEGLIAKAELDNAMLVQENLRAQISLLESNLISMKNNSEAMEDYYYSQLQGLKSQKKSLLNKKTSAEILSPVDGIITSVMGKKGLMASSITPILEISDSKNQVIKSNLSAKVASELKVGDKVEIIKNTQNEEELFIGTISRVSKFAVTEISSLGIPEQKMEVEIISENLKEIPLGFKLDLDFTTASKKDVIGIPRLSVFEKENKDYLLKVVDNKILFQEIELGLETSDRVEVISGLKVGDVIILNPNNVALKEGTRVNYEKTKE